MLALMFADRLVRTQVQNGDVVSVGDQTGHITCEFAGRIRIDAVADIYRTGLSPRSTIPLQVP